MFRTTPPPRFSIPDASRLGNNAMIDGTERSVPPPQLAPVPDEVDRQRRLDQMKRRATGLLVIATIIYIVTRLLEPRYSWLGFLRAMAEAAMSGGLAAWFAVTALFRHPMGIPIPQPP